MAAELLVCDHMIEIQNYINGQNMSPIDGGYLNNYEPATGKLYAHCPDSTGQD